MQPSDDLAHSSLLTQLELEEAVGGILVEAAHRQDILVGPVNTF